MPSRIERRHLGRVGRMQNAHDGKVKGKEERRGEKRRRRRKRRKKRNGGLSK